MTVALSQNVKETDKFNNKYTSSPLKNDSEIEKELLALFKEEKEKGSVILDFKPVAIYKLAKFITGEITRSASIGIAGETASGKSTITLDIIDTIENFAEKFSIKDTITRVNTDDYYYDRSEEVKKAGGMAEFASTMILTCLKL